MQFNSSILNYVATVAEERSISNAAKKLYISQPSLSQSIIALEKSLGVALFDRSIVPLGLTDAGKVFVDAANRVLNIEREMIEQINDISHNGSSNIVVGISSFRNSTIMPRVIPSFRELYPTVHITLIEETNEPVMEMLTSGKIDMAFVTNSDSKDLTYIKLFSDRAVLVLGKKHELCGNYAVTDGDYPIIDMGKLKKDAFTLLNPRSNMRSIANQIFADNNFRPQSIITTSNMEMAHRMAVSNISAAIVQESLLPLYAAEQRGCYFRFPKKDYNTDLFICYRKNFKITRSMLYFIEVSRKILSNVTRQDDEP